MGSRNQGSWWVVVVAGVFAGSFDSMHHPQTIRKSEEGSVSGAEEMASTRSDLRESGHIVNKGAHWEEVVGSDVGVLVVLWVE